MVTCGEVVRQRGVDEYWRPSVLWAQLREDGREVLGDCLAWSFACCGCLLPIMVYLPEFSSVASLLYASLVF